MKTKMLSIAMMFVVMSAITKSTYANTATTAATVLSNIKSFNKIELHGNVELFISDNAPEQVTVYNKYYAENALVQNNKGVLRIASYGAEKLIVWVTSDNLRSISAYDNAEVRSFGEVSKIEFNIDLHDNATAKLNFNAYSANVTLTDHATIELSGKVSAFGMTRSNNATIVNNNFSVDYNTENRIINQTGKKEVLAGLE
ncbi:MAG: GIN domain-containing protein [Sphingobacteriales bacterium]